MNVGFLTPCNRSLFLTSGKFASSRRLSKDTPTSIVMWISNQQSTTYKLTSSSYRFNEMEAPIDSSLYIPLGMLSSYTFSISPGSVCFSLSTAHGDGLSIFEISSESIFNVITRDAFGNIRTHDLENLEVSIVYDSLFHPYVMTSPFNTHFREVSVILNTNAASGHCNHLAGALIGMLYMFSFNFAPRFEAMLKQ